MTDTNLTDIISRAVASRMTPDFIEKEVQTRVDKLIDEAVNSALRSYSETGKLIEAAVADALKVGSLDLPSYGHIVTGILKTQIEANVADLVAGRLSADMEELLSLAPKAVKLSEIAETMLEKHDEGYGALITVIVEHTDYGSTWVYLDEDEVFEDRDQYRAAIRLLVSKDGTISSATIREAEVGKGVKRIGRSYGLEQLVCAYVACGTVITIDEDYVVTSKGDY